MANLATLQVASSAFSFLFFFEVEILRIRPAGQHVQALCMAMANRKPIYEAAVWYICICTICICTI